MSSLAVTDAGTGPLPRIEGVEPIDTPDSSTADAIDRLADGYFEIDEGYRYQRVNPAGLRIAGKTRAEMIGKHVFDVFPDVERSAIHQTTVQVMESRQPQSVETYYPPHNRWYVNSIYPIGGGVAIFSRDITERKLMEQNLAFLAEASKILSSSLDYHHTLRTVAQLAVPRIADWCAVDMLAGHRVELLAVAHVEPEKSRWAEAMREREPVDLDESVGLAQVLRTGRSEFYPQISDALLVATAKDEPTLELARSLGLSSAMMVPLVLRDTPVGAITFVTAESGRHYTVADLRMAEELASRAALAIENSRLYGESQQAVALRDDFISAASHELKTPVTSLKIYTELLLRQSMQRGDERTSSHLQRMNGQIERLAVLVSDLLDVSKIEAGKLELRREVVELWPIVDEVVEAVQTTTTKHRIEIVGNAERTILGDRERLSQVLTNLLTNAVKYSPRANRIVVRLTEPVEGARIEVEDFGIGIEEEHLDQIFDRFYRVSSADERTFPGLGMGLFISREIVRRHGGTMEVTSTKGQGSVFSFCLPYADPMPTVAPLDGGQ
jgi:PAS domain S-box-containing protein